MRTPGPLASLAHRLVLFSALGVLAGCAASPQPAPAPTEAATPAQPPPTDADVLYHVFAAEVAGSDGDLEQAVDGYLEAALTSPDPEIAARATQVAFAAAAWQQAAMAAVRWSELAPEDRAAQIAAARALLRVEDYAAAEIPLRRLLEGVDDPAGAWLTVADLLEEAPSPADATALLNELVVRSGDDLPVTATLARSRLAARAGELDAAEALAEEALARDPERAESHVWAGRLALARGDSEAAVAHFDTAWRQAPDNADVALAYAELLAMMDRPLEADEVLAGLAPTPALRTTRIAYALRAGDTERAEELYAGFDRMRGDADEIAFEAARAAELMDRPREAIARYGEVRGGENGLAASLRRAWLMADLGNLEAARNELVALRTANDRSVQVESWLAEGQLLREHGQPEAAYAAYDEGIAALGDSADLRYARALLAVELDRLDQAEIDLRRILEADPNNATVLNALGYTLADRTDRFEEAEALIREAYALQPDEPSIIDSMGWIAYRLGRLDEAAHYLRIALSLEENAEIAAHLGEVLWVQGHRQQALAVWRRAQRADAENAVLRETLDRFGVAL